MTRPVPAPVVFLLSGVSMYAGSALAARLFAVVPAHAVAWWRVAVAAVVLLAWVRPWRARWTARELGASALFGVVLAVMNVLFYLAIARLPMGTAVSLEYVGPVVVAALGSRGLRGRLAVVLAAAGVLSIGGLGVDWEVPGTAAGVALALGAGAAWAGYIVLGRAIAARRDGLVSLSVGMAAGGVVLAPAMASTIGTALVDAETFLAVVGVALLSSVLPYALEQLVLARVPAATFALLTSLLPAVSVVVGLVVLGQVPSVGELAGLVLVSAAVAVSGGAVARAYRRSPAPARGRALGVRAGAGRANVDDVGSRAARSRSESRSPMSILWIIIAGAVIGALARLFMKGDQNMGILWTVILGAAGAAVGYLVADAFGVADTGGGDWIRWAISIVLAIVFISIYLGVTRGRRTTHH